VRPLSLVVEDLDLVLALRVLVVELVALLQKPEVVAQQLSMVMVAVVVVGHGQLLVSEMIQILELEGQDILVMETMAPWVE
jgi:hypothetical protein